MNFLTIPVKQQLKKLLDPLHVGFDFWIHIDPFQIELFQPEEGFGDLPAESHMRLLITVVNNIGDEGIDDLPVGFP